MATDERGLRLRSRLDRGVQANGAQAKSSLAHSKAYHRHFAGYAEAAVPAPDGKGRRIVRVYTGAYYRQDLSARRRVLVRVAHLVLFLGAAALFIAGAVQPTASNTTWYTVLPQALSVPFLAWTLLALVAYIPAPAQMSIAQHRSAALALRRATLGAALSLGATALVTLGFAALHPTLAPTTALGAGAFLLGALLALAMHRLETRIPYLIIANPQQPPANSYAIK